MESQDAAATFLFKLWPWIEANRKRLFAGAIAVLALILGISIYSWRHEQNQTDAGDAMTETLLTIPPNADPSEFSQRYLDIASDYAGTPAGTRSLLQGATALFAQGKYTDAQGYFQRYLDEHPDDEFSGLAALGVARCQEAEGKISDAEGTYQHVALDSGDQQSVNQANFSLARINMQQGKLDEAFKGFQQVIQADPYGSLGNEARQYAIELQSKLPRPASPSSPSSPTSRPSPSPFNLSH